MGGLQKYENFTNKTSRELVQEEFFFLGVFRERTNTTVDFLEKGNTSDGPTKRFVLQKQPLLGGKFGEAYPKEIQTIFNAPGVPF